MPVAVRPLVIAGAGGRLIVIPSGADPVLLLLSVTVKVRAEVPVADGVPPMRPIEEFNVSPGGRVPMARE